MSKISKLFILQFLLTPLYTQKLKIQDMQTKEPLAGVNVFSSTYGTTTDTNGVCSLEKFSEKDEIIFSHIGYKMIKRTKHNLSYKTGVANLQQWFLNKFYLLIDQQK